MSPSQTPFMDRWQNPLVDFPKVTDPILLVVIGAGASHNVERAIVGGAASQSHPPLTAHLFERDYGVADPWGWHHVPHSNEIALDLERLARTGRSLGFEEALSEIFTASSCNPAGRAIKFLALNIYLARLFRHYTTYYGKGGGLLNTYTELVNYVVKRWAFDHGFHVVFVSVNYDEILERSLRNDGSGPLKFLDYVRPEERHSVVKVHGSCYWSRTYRMAGKTRPESLPELLNIAPKLASIGSSTLAYGGLGDDSWFTGFVQPDEASETSFEVRIPALSMPFDDASDPKALFRNIPESLRAWLISQLGHVVATLTIGWSGHDRHLIDLLIPLTDGRPLWIVSPDAENVLNRIGRSDSRAVPVSMGFYEFLISQRLDDFLDLVQASPGA